MRRTRTDVSTEAQKSTITRRSYLAALAAAGAVGIAGCSTDGSDNGTADGADAPGEETPSGDGSDGSDDGMLSDSDGGTTDGGTDDRCPATPLTYTEQPLPEGSPEIVFDRPEGEYVGSSDASDDSVQLRLGSDTIARLNVSIELFENESVQERVEFLDLTDATDEYEVPLGARVVVNQNPDRPIPPDTYVILPMGSGSAELLVYHNGGFQWCPDALAAIHRRLVESTRLP